MKPIFFIHPPKSGGSTVVSFFELNMGAGQFSWFVTENSAEWTDERRKLLSTGIGGGHHSYGVHQGLKTALEYCTILRDPLERQISHFWYTITGKNAVGSPISLLESQVQRGEISLDCWVRNSMAGKNLLTKMLSGRSTVDNESLEIAKKNLEDSISVVGFCDGMSSFLLRLCTLQGFELPFYVKTNETKSKQSHDQTITENSKEAFWSDNAFDSKLYEYAEDLVERQSVADGQLFKNALSVVEKVQLEINQLENPQLHKTLMSGFNSDHLASVKNVISRFDLTPISEWIAHARARFEQSSRVDLFAGNTDAVADGYVTGWVTNLTTPEKPALVEVRVGDQIVATGWNDATRSDVLDAGYPSSKVGFSIKLPNEALGGFRITIANCREVPLNNRWHFGWHTV